LELLFVGTEVTEGKAPSTGSLSIKDIWVVSDFLGAIVVVPYETEPRHWRQNHTYCKVSVSFSFYRLL